MKAACAGGDLFMTCILFYIVQKYYLKMSLFYRESHCVKTERQHNR